MKRKAMVTQVVCDYCGTSGCYESCLLCGKDVCYECKKTKAVGYKYAVNLSGYDDGIYCLPCDKKAEVDADPIHSAYRAILKLENEAKAWNDDFDRRRKRMDKRLQTLLRR